MKLITLVIIVTSIGRSLSASDRLWVTDNAISNTTRQADWRPAARIETANGVLRLLAEHNGKLVCYFESNDQNAIQQLIHQMGYADKASGPSHVPIAPGTYVDLSKIASVEYRKTGDAEVCILRGFTVEFGTVTNPKDIARIRTAVKAQ